MSKMKIFRRMKNHKGVTLVETLVATIVLGIMVVPILSTFVATTKINAKARARQDQTVIAQGVMEELKSTTIKSLLDSYAESASSDATFQFAGYTIPADGWECGKTLGSDNQYYQKIVFEIYNLNGYKVHAEMKFDENSDGYGLGSASFSEMALPQMYKYRIEVKIYTLGAEESAEPLMTINGTKTESYVFNYSNLGGGAPAGEESQAESSSGEDEGDE